MFLVIDGIDGSGKGTQTQILKEHFESLGKKVKILDFPRYGEKSAFMVEKYLNGKYGKDISPKLASLFYAIDRYDCLVEEDFSQYDYIISNRYVSANMIHQSGKIQDENEAKEFLEWLYDLEFHIFGIPKPDKVIFLNVPASVSQKLIAKKQQRSYIEGNTNKDIHEEDINHLQNAREKALMITKMYNNWIQIDCTQNDEILPIEEITKKILKEIS